MSPEGGEVGDGGKVEGFMSTSIVNFERGDKAKYEIWA